MKKIIALSVFALSLGLGMIYGSEKFVQTSDLHVPIIIDGINS